MCRAFRGGAFFCGPLLFFFVHCLLFLCIFHVFLSLSTSSICIFPFCQFFHVCSLLGNGPAHCPRRCHVNDACCQKHHTSTKTARWCPRSATLTRRGRGVLSLVLRHGSGANVGHGVLTKKVPSEGSWLGDHPGQRHPHLSGSSFAWLVPMALPDAPKRTGGFIREGACHSFPTPTQGGGVLPLRSSSSTPVHPRGQPHSYHLGEQKMSTWGGFPVGGNGMAYGKLMHSVPDWPFPHNRQTEP